MRFGFNLAMCMALVSSGAFAQDLATATIDACIEAEPASVDLVAELESIGWKNIEASALDDANFPSIAALMITDQFLGNEPAIRWQSGWERSLASAAGNTRKIFIEDSPNHTYWFETEMRTNTLRMQTEDRGAYQHTQCDFAIQPDIAQESFAPMVQANLTDEMPALLHAKDQSFADESADKFLKFSLFQPSKISELVADEFTFIGRVSVFNVRKR